VDGVLVVNELIDLAKKTGKECLVFKVDYEKAYDSVDWGFLEYMLHRFGFCYTWIKWMRSCVFAGNLSILVNGSLTKEFNIHRGLKQGDPLAPFLFLLVAEEFGDIMRKAMEINLFKGFSVGRDGMIISHLQYADDTLCLGEVTVQNIWTIKSILRGFHMASGLKVNFWKSSLMGVNVSEEFMELACDFLNCRRGQIPFKYLGLPVGANPKRISTWEPLIEYLKKRLTSWGKKHISLSGRIVMINSVLNSIPIFFMSFLKMPVQVYKRVIRIQRELLWGGVKGGRKVNWISWKTVCREKKDGGLGVRDIRIVNVSLLAKWRWRLLQSEPALWKEVIVVKYRAGVLTNVVFNGIPGARFASSWWKDICSLENYVDSKNWLSEAIVRKVNDGATTSFWSHVWHESVSTAVAFLRLFSLSVQKEATIADMVVVTDDQIGWGFMWRQRLFRWEEDLLGRLITSLAQVVLSMGADVWIWKPDVVGVFSVKSSYDLLCKEEFAEVEDAQNVNKVFSQIWKSPAPSKLIAFSWQLIHNRIPTRDILARCGIIRGDNSRVCVMCANSLESSRHLFLHCDFASRVWTDIFRWLGVIIIMSSSLPILLHYLLGFAKTKKTRKGYMLVWHTALWLIWRLRNEVIFNNSAKVVVEEIKLLS
jgi:hypothetical protein